MIRLRIVIILSILLLSGCSNSYIVELQNGYKIWFMSATKVYIGNKDDSLVVGPNVEGIYTKGYFIVGNVNDSDKGYFIIDTVKDSVKKDMTKSAWQTELEAIGLSKGLSLIPPTTNYAVHRK